MYFMRRRKKIRLRIGKIFLLILFMTALTTGIVSAFKYVGAFLQDKPADGESLMYNEDNVKIIANSDDYIIISVDYKEIYKGNLVLVNNKNLYNFEEDENLVSLYDYKSLTYNVKDKNVLLLKEIIEPLNNMLNDFYNKYNLKTLNVVSGYRTLEFQQSLYENEVFEKGELEAQKWVAKPGGSEHHTGLALDFSIFYNNGTSACYNGTGDYAWINDNAYKYGFIVRYDEIKSDITGISYEPWHFRYVGIPHSYIMTQNGFCLEEYIDHLRQYEFGKKHLSIEYEGVEYEIYFTKDTQIYVPKDKKYAISGNNQDGFIITSYGSKHR